jgi:hypothetical protein
MIMLPDTTSRACIGIFRQQETIMALSPSDQLAATSIYHALTFISTNGTLLPSGDRAMERSAIIADLKRREMTLFDAWGRGLRGASGSRTLRKPRWQDELERHSSNYVNADFLRKEGVWYLTSAGNAVLLCGAEYMFNKAREAYDRDHGQ